MKIIETPLQGFVVVDVDVYGDERGFFLETYQDHKYHELGIKDMFVQDNQSRSLKGVLRGMHFQVKQPQSQMVTVLRGRIFDVGVDLRPGSPTFGKWHGVELSDSGLRQVYMAPGFAHGFCVLSDWADLHYKVSRRYDKHDEGGLRWNDPVINIQWPVVTPVVTPRDAAFPLLREIPESGLPHISLL